MISHSLYADQKGVSLIEVLVTVLVISVGFLGMVALQAKSLSTNNSAMSRSIATVSSYSILDAMRLDRTNALNGSYNQQITADDCPASGSTLRSEQIHAWCGQLGKYFGAEATTKAEISCASSGVCEVVITYDDSRGTNLISDETQTFRTRAML